MIRKERSQATLLPLHSRWEKWTGLQSAKSNQCIPTKLPACFQSVYYQSGTQSPESQAARQLWCVTAGLPSARMVKGESPGRLAENWPPREVIRKHKLKKPTPTTKILQGKDKWLSGKKKANHNAWAQEAEAEKENDISKEVV